MDKKVSAGKMLSPGKLAGIIFCILAGICTVVLLFMDVYFSGQMKVIDKCFKSVARGDYNGTVSCLSEWGAHGLTEDNFEEETEWIRQLIDGDEVKTSVTFVERRICGDAYCVYFDLTVYNDDDHITEEVEADIILKDMKWIIDDFTWL